MNENAQDPNELRLSKFGLTCFLAAVVILPVAMIALIWFSLPKVLEHPLPVKVRLAEQDGQQVLVVKNDSEGAFDNVGITLNDWFNFYSADPLPGGEELAISLGSFTRKNGIPFDPSLHQLTEIGVYAQLEDNSRGVWDRRSENLMEQMQAESEQEQAPNS